MSAMSSQAAHPTLVIPGPVEFDDAVLQSMGHYAEGHTGMPFVNVFGETLTLLRKLFITENPDSQPLVVSGSGTLGWDFVASNLAEQGDEVLVLHTGYFADSFAECFKSYGVSATQLKAPPGSRPKLPDIESALKSKSYKIITITHVDTSTGVLSDVQAIAALVHAVSPSTLVVVDAVCSLGVEPLHFDAWGLDVVLTGSQKGIGVPAGLSISMYSSRALAAWQARSAPPSSYYASLANWVPIMRSYEARKPSYFATPSTQLVHALYTSLQQILAVPLAERFARHARASDAMKAAVAALGLRQLAEDEPEAQSHAMTAVYVPEGMEIADIVPELLKQGVVVAAGLHKDVGATKYFRIGHMGISVMEQERGDMGKVEGALKTVIGRKKST